jgi:transposase
VAEWIDIRALAREGLSVSEIARRSGHDRKTVRAVLLGEGPKLKRSTKVLRASKLDPYRDYLRERANQGCLNAAVLYEEIKGLGYEGKLSILRDFLRPIRVELAHKREATIRFETGPAKQAQVDWADFGRVWDSFEGCWKKLYLFIFTLGYSRAMYLEFTTSLDMEHFLGAHLGAFSALGIPGEILYDNLKTGILGRDEQGKPIFPGRFLDFSLYYGFSPKFCRPARPQTKGKVERSVGYVRQNFWVRVGRRVGEKELELGELNEAARTWLDNVANCRLHGTHGELVSGRLAEERPHLGSLKARVIYDISYHFLRRVGRDGRFSHRGQVYELPLSYRQREVWVDEALDGSLKVRGRDGRVARFRVVGTRGAPKPRSGAAPATSSLAEVGQGYPPVQVRDLGVYEAVAHVS